MRILDLFSGTHSVGKVARALGHEVLSLDLSGADINMDVLDWDYTTYPMGRFDFIWASPPCQQMIKYWETLITTTRFARWMGAYLMRSFWRISQGQDFV